MNTCSVCGKEILDSNTHTRTIDGEFYVLCGKHYSQYMVHHRFLDNSPFSGKEPNKVIIDGDSAIIIATDNNGNETGRCTVDADKVDILLQHKWRCRGNRFYTNIPREGQTPMTISIYRFLLGFGKDRSVTIDHIDHDPTNNRLSNLRIVDQQKNCMNQSMKYINTSGVSGVSRKRKRWYSSIKYKYITYNLGSYDDFNDAVYARFIAELLIFREYRNTDNDVKIKECISKVTAKKKKEIRTCVYKILLPLAKEIDDEIIS